MLEQPGSASAAPSLPPPLSLLLFLLPGLFLAAAAFSVSKLPWPCTLAPLLLLCCLVMATPACTEGLSFTEWATVDDPRRPAAFRLCALVCGGSTCALLAFFTMASASLLAPARLAPAGSFEGDGGGGGGGSFGDLLCVLLFALSFCSALQGLWQVRVTHSSRLHGLWQVRVTHSPSPTPADCTR
jgi:hypothetical protein